MPTYAQKDFKPGYVITNDEDTLYGLINLRSNFSNSRKCIYKKDKDAEEETFMPGEIKAYRIENHKYYLFKAVEINGQTGSYFLEYLVSGITDLYYLNNPESEYYFIEKEGKLILLSNATIMRENVDGTTYAFPSNQYIGVLKYEFRDAPELSKEINNTSFSYKSLIDITKKYHNSICKDYVCIDYSRSVKTSLRFESYIGMINSWIGMETSDEHIYDASPLMGFNFDIKPAKILQRWGLQIGLNYANCNFTGVFGNSLYTDIERSFKVHAAYSMIGLPLMIEYSFPVRKIQPYLSAGYHNIFVINPEWYAHRTEYEWWTIDSDFRDYQFGLLLGAGFRFWQKNQSFFYLKNEAEYRQPLVNLGHFFDYHSALSWKISAGYGFSLTKASHTARKND
jgi:hypothetical protein